MRRSDEAKHFLAVGDTGVGKSHVIRQLLYYARACGDLCVVLDSKLEFIPEFYDATRGDKILSPADERCVWWDLGNELTDEIDAIALTTSLYASPLDSSGHYNGKWFDEHARNIAAYLLANSNPRPSCEEFGRWLCDPENEIKPRLAGSEHIGTLNQSAANQYAGVVGTLNKVGRALRMLPRDSELKHRQRFTIREWAESPVGWLFLPNTAETRDALRPLQSGWVDMCIARVMSSKQRAKRIWIVLDELDTLGPLSKLHDGMTQLRSTGHPMVLGIQNFEQLEDRYGKQARTIFSQAFTKFILAVSEGNTAKALEGLIGDEEIRRFRENRTGSLFGTRDRAGFSGPEDVRKPLIWSSEIQGLPDLCGYFLQRPTTEKIGLNVVNFKLPYMPPVKHCEGLVRRKLLGPVPPAKEAQPAPPPGFVAQPATSRSPSAGAPAKTGARTVPDSAAFLAQSSTWRPPLDLTPKSKPDANNSHPKGAYD